MSLMHDIVIKCKYKLFNLNLLQSNSGLTLFPVFQVLMQTRFPYKKGIYPSTCDIDYLTGVVQYLVFPRAHSNVKSLSVSSSSKSCILLVLSMVRKEVFLGSVHYVPRRGFFGKNQVPKKSSSLKTISLMKPQLILFVHNFMRNQLNYISKL